MPTNSLLRPDKINTRLSQAAGLTKIRSGAAALYGHNPSVYASKDESPLAAANDVLRCNGYVPFPVESKTVVPNFYGVTYVRKPSDIVNNETFGLRLARHGNNPVPLSLVSLALDGTLEYFDDCRTVYDPLSEVAGELAVKFMLAYPTRGHYWLPRFALPARRQV